MDRETCNQKTWMRIQQPNEPTEAKTSIKTRAKVSTEIHLFFFMRIDGTNSDLKRRHTFVHSVWQLHNNFMCDWWEEEGETVDPVGGKNKKKKLVVNRKIQHAKARESPYPSPEYVFVSFYPLPMTTKRRRRRKERTNGNVSENEIHTKKEKKNSFFFSFPSKPLENGSSFSFLSFRWDSQVTHYTRNKEKWGWHQLRLHSHIDYATAKTNANCSVTVYLD